jgi:hypothetical protein
MLRCTLALVTVVFVIAAHSQTAPQTPPPTPYSAAAPKALLLVYQQFLPGKAGTRQNLEMELARTFDQLAVPISWVELESLTGSSEALFIDPVSSFAEIEKAGTALAQLYATRADLAQSQQQIDDVIASSRTLTAMLRDDLSLSPAAFNFAKARYLRIRVVHVRPERERDFVNAVASHHPQSEGQARVWAAYQVNGGMPDLTFLFIEPMRSMQEVDQEWPGAALELAPLETAASSETNFYAIHPEMSHVSKEFAATEPKFWMQTPAP